ncbi:MAG TPA: YncE family protein, partial [Methanocella sp.]|nr:YncE family protein [Methanocella sp.]
MFIVVLVVLVVLVFCLAGPARAANADRLYAVGFNGTYLSYTTPWAGSSDNATGKVSLYLLDATTGRQAAGVLLDEPAYYMAISSSGKWLGLTNGRSRNVTIANTNLTTLVKVPLNTSPCGIAFSPNDSVLYVALPAERAIVALDAPNGTISWRVPLEDAPYYLAVSPNGRRIYATNTLDDSFTVVDVISKRPLVTVPSGAKPMDVVVSPDGASIYVAAGGDDSIVVYDAANYPVKAVVSGVKAPACLALDPAGRRLFVTSFQGSDVVVVNTTTYGVDMVWSAGAAGLGWPAVNGDGSRVLVTSQTDEGIDVFDATTGSRVGVINSTGPVMAMALYKVPPGEP